MRRLGAIAVVLGAVAVVRPAHAEETPHDQAVRLFNEARRDIQNENCNAAKPKLVRSLDLEPSIGAHISLADCVQADDPYDAFWHLRDAALFAYVKHDDRFLTVEERSAALAKTLGGIRFDIDPTDLRAPGLDVRIDGRTVDRFHIAGAMALEPGDHALLITVADGRRLERKVHVDLGQTTLVRVVLLKSESGGAPPGCPPPPTYRPMHAPPEPPRAPTLSDLTGRQWLAVGLGGAGIAALAVGSAYGIVAIEKRSELDRACNGSADACTGSPGAVDPVFDSAKSNATVSTVLLAAGGALLVGGIVVWITAPKNRDRAARATGAVLTW